MSSLPVRYVGFVVPVIPALQCVDIDVHTGLATGHRTRHGETRGSEAAGLSRDERRVTKNQEWVPVVDQEEGGRSCVGAR